MTIKQWFWNLLFILLILLKYLLIEIPVIKFTVIKLKIELVMYAKYNLMISTKILF